MRIKPLGSNQTELSIGDYTVLFSYRTPVAYNLSGVGFYRTATKYSTTTSRHINSWLDGAAAETVPQEQIDSILDGG